MPQLWAFGTFSGSKIAMAKKVSVVLSKKEIERCKKLCRTNYRGMIKLKHLLGLYAFLPSDEWTFQQPQGNELLHGIKEGRRDAVLWWNATKKQIECNRMGAVVWYVYCIRNDIAL